VAVGLLDGLLTLQGWVSHQDPNAAWIRAQIAHQPLVYAYLVVATFSTMAVLGWLLGRKEDLLEELSVTDPLTGLANRRRLRGEFALELRRAARYETPMALLLVDLDRLKQINDGRGHAAGDRALQLVADSLRESCRAADVLARLGGDELVVLAVSTTASEALALAHRIRATVRRRSAARTNGASFPVTVSIGAADLERAAGPSFEALLAAADEALYRAKNGGRDRAELAPPRPRSDGPLRLVRQSDR
jgi:diguanylate cyclase (GGDEF)-like protein